MAPRTGKPSIVVSLLQFLYDLVDSPRPKVGEERWGVGERGPEGLEVPLPESGTGPRDGQTPSPEVEPASTTTDPELLTTGDIRSPVRIKQSGLGRPRKTGVRTRTEVRGGVPG